MDSQATQQFVPIKEIKDGVVLLKDNSLRILLMTSSHNLALKSGDEQKAILFQFQSFLNSLDFSIQFYIQSRRLDIRPYIALLEERSGEQTSDLMKIQVTEYIDFVKKFVENVNIMSKSFFVVVPYTPPLISAGRGNSPMDLLSNIFSKKKGGVGVQEKARAKLEIFEENRSQLEQRALVVEQGLSRIGIRVVQLGTEELVELYYKIFNPGELEKPIMPT